MTNNGRMASLVIVAHAPLASALQAVAGHVFPDRAAALVAVDVPPQWSAEEAEVALRNAVALAGADGREVLILADVFGATPCNAAQRVADGSRWRVVAGVNVPMLWRDMCYADRALDELVERALAGATQGVMPASPQKPQDQPLHCVPNDPSHSHHQQ
jgi:PTS system ascorbate-specific IIA component